MRSFDDELCVWSRIPAKALRSERGQRTKMYKKKKRGNSIWHTAQSYLISQITVQDKWQRKSKHMSFCVTVAVWIPFNPPQKYDHVSRWDWLSKECKYHEKRKPTKVGAVCSSVCDTNGLNNRLRRALTSQTRGDQSKSKSELSKVDTR